MLREMAGVARFAPAFAAPAFLDDRDDIDLLARAHGIDHDMLPVAEKDGDAVARDRGRGLAGGDRDAPGGSPRRLGRAAADKGADARADAVGADQDVKPALRAAGRDADTVGILADQRYVRSGLDGDGRIGLGRLDEDRLQVGPVQQTVGRAMTLRRQCQRQRDDGPPALHAAHLDGGRPRRDGIQRRAEPEIVEDAAGIRRDLQPGADFREGAAALEDGDLEARAREQQRRRQPGDAASRDRDVGRHSDPSGRHRLDEEMAGRQRIGAVQARIETVERRAIGADALVACAEIDIDMRVVEGRLGADAHEFLHADLDQRDAGIVVKMRDDVLGHGGFRSFDDSCRDTRASRRR